MLDVFLINKNSNKVVEVGGLKIFSVCGGACLLCISYIVRIYISGGIDKHVRPHISNLRPGGIAHRYVFVWNFLCLLCGFVFCWNLL